MTQTPTPPASAPDPRAALRSRVLSYVALAIVLLSGLYVWRMVEDNRRRRAAVWERQGMDAIFNEVNRLHADLWSELVSGDGAAHGVRRLRRFVGELERIDTSAAPARFAYAVDEVRAIADNAADALAAKRTEDYYRLREDLAAAVGRLPEIIRHLRTDPVDLKDILRAETAPRPAFEDVAREVGLQPLGTARADGVSAVLWRIERLGDGRLAAWWLVRAEGEDPIDGAVADAAAPGRLANEDRSADALAARPTSHLTVAGRDLYPPEGAFLFRQVFPADAPADAPAVLSLSLRLFFADAEEKQLRFDVRDVNLPPPARRGRPS